MRSSPNSPRYATDPRPADEPEADANRPTSPGSLAAFSTAPGRAETETLEADRKQQDAQSTTRSGGLPLTSSQRKEATWQ